MPILEPPPQTPLPAAPYTPSEDVPFPDTSLLVTDDGAPVDNLYTEKQQRLLVEPLYISWSSPDGQPFRAMCNVGLFHAYKEPPHVPDAMVAFGVPPTDDILKPDNRSYFMWVVGKPPDIVIEVVSNRYGGETTNKFQHYARIGVPYYVVYDPLRVLSTEKLRGFTLVSGNYVPLDVSRINSTGLGLKLWEGEYELEKAVWLRWCDSEGNIIPNSKENVDRQRTRADEESKRANEESKRAELAESALAAERRKIEELSAQLKSLQDRK